MFTDDARLTYSVQSKRVTIMDNISQDMFVRNADSYAECNTLSHDVIYKHVQLLQQQLVGKRLNWLMYKPFTNIKGEESTKIMEFDNLYRFIVGGKCAELKDGVLVGEHGFNVTKLLQDLNFAYGLVYSEGTLLRPKYDVVRFVSDANIYICKYLKSVLVVRCNNVTKNLIRNCLFNDVLYDELSFNLDLQDKVCSFYDKDMNRVWSVPIDFSVSTYFVDKVYEDEEEE